MIPQPPADRVILDISHVYDQRRWVGSILDFLYWIREASPTIPTKKPKIWDADSRSDAGFVASMSSYLYLGGGSSPTFLRFGFGPTISVRVWDCADDGDPQPKSPGSDILIQHRQLNRYGFTAPDGSLILIASDLARGVDDPT